MKNKVFIGDAIEGLRQMPEKVAHTCVTSPPYYGLRDYGMEGQIGLEETPEAFIQKLVEVFREVRRVLRDDGTLWVNMGDSYSSGMANASDLIESELKDGVFFIGSGNPCRGSSKRIYILIYDKTAPDDVFLPFFTSKRVAIKNGQNDFCQIGNVFDPPIHCFHSRSLSLTCPSYSDPNGFMDMGQNIGIVVTTGDLNADSLIRSSVSFSIKNSKTSFPIEISAEPESKIIRNDVPFFDSFSFNSGSKSISNIDQVDKPIALRNTLNSPICNGGDFAISKSGKEHISFRLMCGVNFSVSCVGHLFCYKNGLIPYSEIWSKAKKKSNYFQAKQEIGTPFLLRAALMEDGWICRQTIIWNKPNPMPESVTDRCTKAHEYIFLLSKSPKYYYDQEAVKEDAVYSGITGMDESGFKNPALFNGKHSASLSFKRKNSKREVTTHRANREDSVLDGKRNKRSVWTIATKPFPEAHFATFPENLIIPCIKAGCPNGGIVLDPFMGSGTTALVARSHGRNYLGCELNPEYDDIRDYRIKQKLGMFA